MSPLLDEAALVSTLNVPVAVQTAEFTRTAASLCILDALDRRLQRNYVGNIINNAIQLNERIRELEILARLTWDFEQGKTLEEVAKACQDLFVVKLQHAEAHRKALLQIMDEVVQCPWEGTTIQ